MLRGLYIDPFVCPCVLLAFSKIIPYKTHTGQSFTPEPVGLNFFYVFSTDLFLIFICRPIPQWFRLKTDTKIQVRC